MQVGSKRSFFQVFLAAIFFLVFVNESRAAFQNVSFKGEGGLSLNARVYSQQVTNANSKLKPAVLIIEGYGRSRSDHDLESSPFFQLAQNLSDQGFLVMTFSKRGSASNLKNGSWAKSSFWIDNVDAQGALDFLRNYSGVDKSKLFLLGQSIGCLQASELAQKNSVAGVIAVSGAYQNYAQVLDEQSLDLLGLYGISPSEAKFKIAPYTKAYSEIKAGKFECEKRPEICKVEEGASVIDGSQEKYLAEIFKLDPLAEVGKVSAPVLILQGASDFVTSTHEYDLAKSALSPKKNFSFELLTGVDHFMSDQKDKMASFQAMKQASKTKAFPPLSKRVVDSINAWSSAVSTKH